MGRRGHGEGSIFQRNDGRWAATISLENGKRKTYYGKTRRSVQEQLKTALHQQQQGMLVATPQQKAAQFLTHWLEDVHKHVVRPRTYERYEVMIRRHLIPGLGQHSLQKLSPQHLHAFNAQKLADDGGGEEELHLALDRALRWNLVFCTTIGTHLSSSRTFCEQFKAPLKKACLLLSIGVHPKVVQELGHSQISMTMDNYPHALPTIQEEAINRLNGVLGG